MTAATKRTAQEKNAALHRREREESAREDAMQEAAAGATIYAVKCLDGKAYIRYSLQAAQIEVKGVNYKYHEHDNVHAGIVATRTLDNGRTMTLTTPLMPLESDDQAVASHTKEAAETLKAMREEARMYLGGKRAQGNLFAGLAG